MAVSRIKLKFRACTVDGCERKVVSRGLCFAHYQRWRRHGVAEGTIREPVDASAMTRVHVLLPNELVDGVRQDPRNIGLSAAIRESLASWLSRT